jgi:deoxyribonuclease-4
MPKQLKLGAHASIAKGFTRAARDIVEVVGGDAVQIFLKSPRSSTKTRLTEAAAAEYKQYAKEYGVFTVAHCSYLLNFAKPLKATDWPLTSLIDDLWGVEQLGGAGVVLHIGKHLELSREEGLRHVVTNLKQVLSATKDLKAKILLENTAGQGTELGYTFEELATIYRGLRRASRVQFCFDTCHAHAAGYSLATAAGVRQTFAQWEQLIGLDQIACFHFNDAKSEAGSRVDRHANLAHGTIGQAGLTAVARLAAQHGIPLILETPADDLATYTREVAQIRTWLGGK